MAINIGGSLTCHTMFCRCAGCVPAAVRYSAYTKSQLKLVTHTDGTPACRVTRGAGEQGGSAQSRRSARAYEHTKLETKDSSTAIIRNSLYNVEHDLVDMAPRHSVRVMEICINIIYMIFTYTGTSPLPRGKPSRALHSNAARGNL